jgi:hypothetical protein
MQSGRQSNEVLLYPGEHVCERKNMFKKNMKRMANKYNKEEFSSENTLSRKPSGPQCVDANRVVEFT